MSRYWDDDYGYGEFYPPSQPLHADGIKARSKRGEIGESWWSQRFIEILESLGHGPRMQRGRAYARRGQVLSLTVLPGVASASVQGSRAKPYTVKIKVALISEERWAALEAAFAANALYAAELLAGEIPAELEDLFLALDAPLFPRSLRFECSCPDGASPCKHAAAALYLLAERFDDDPFSVLAWRGRERETLLAALRASRGVTSVEPAAAAEPESRSEPLRLEGFWGSEPPLLRFSPHAAEFPEAILMPLDRLPGGRDPVRLFRRTYRRAAELAERYALAD